MQVTPSKGPLVHTMSHPQQLRRLALNQPLEPDHHESSFLSSHAKASQTSATASSTTSRCSSFASKSESYSSNQHQYSSFHHRNLFCTSCIRLNVFSTSSKRWSDWFKLHSPGSFMASQQTRLSFNMPLDIAVSFVTISNFQLKTLCFFCFLVNF